MIDRDKLLKVFDIGPEDIEACRAGRLGPGQARRLRRSGLADIVGALALGLGLAAILLFIVHKPLKPAQWITSLVLFALLLAVGLNHSRKMARAIADGRVECLTGEVDVRSRGKNGFWLTVSGRSFRLPVRPWNVSSGERYRVYISILADQIVGMEPDG